LGQKTAPATRRREAMSLQGRTGRCGASPVLSLQLQAASRHEQLTFLPSQASRRASFLLEDLNSNRKQKAID
jgi:hypothetical protein